MASVKCNGCGYVGDESEFRKGRDFFQHVYIAGCPRCDNWQSPGGASMRMMGGARPFEYVDAAEEPTDPLQKVLHIAEGAS